MNRTEAIMRAKKWYRFQNDEFSWMLSIAALADDLGAQDATELRRVVESAFDQEGLAKVIVENNIEKSLIDILIDFSKKYNFSLLIWTEGDPKWQVKKTTQSGILGKINKEQFCCFASDKVGEIPALISETSCSTLIVIDDKSTNIAKVHKLQEAGLLDGINIIGYNLLLDSHENSVSMFITWLEDLFKSEKLTGRDTLLLVDMDGVLIDTNSILFDRVSKSINHLVNV